MKITAKVILKQARVGESKTGSVVTPKEIAGLAEKHWVTVYQNMDADPLPQWLYEAIMKWYQKSGPIKPRPVDETFKWYMANAWKRLVPDCPFETKRGRSKAHHENDDDDNPNGGKAKCKNGERSAEKTQTSAGVSLIESMKAESAALSQSGSVGATISGGLPVTGQAITTTSSALLSAPDLNLSGCATQLAEKNTLTPECQMISTTKFDPSTEPSMKSGSAQKAAFGLDSTSPIAHLNNGAVPGGSFQPNNPQGGFLPRGGENPPPPCDHAILTSAAKAWRHMEKSQRNVTAFVRACWHQPWAFGWAESCRRKKIMTALNRAAGIKLRDRAPDADVQKTRAAILSIIGPPYADHRKRDQHSKGAYDAHAFGSAKACLQGVLDTPAIQKALTEAVGEIPTFNYCYELVRSSLHVDSYAEVKDHIQQTIGFRPAYDGHVLLADATGLPVRVDGAWGAKNPGSRGNKNGFQKHWLHMAVDVGSAYSWIHPTFSDNEASGWPPFLSWLLIDQLQYAPEHLSVDEVSGVFSWLRDPAADGIPNLPAEVLLWLAAGVKPYVHAPGRPTGGAHAEVNIKGAKNTLARITIRRALEKELAGQGLKKSRHFDSQAELLSTIGELREKINARHLGRAGDTRVNLWNDAESAAKRSLRALVPNAAAIWREIVSRTKTASVSGKTIMGKSGGSRIVADISTDLDFKPLDCPALVFPCGLRVGDDPELRRVLLVEPRPGQPVYHLAEAKVALRDRRGFDLRQPIYGTGYVAAAETRNDQIQKFRDEASELHRARVSALKTGTTGTTDTAETIYE
jgi:hypothetical protein